MLAKYFSINSFNADRLLAYLKLKWYKSNAIVTWIIITLAGKITIVYHCIYRHINKNIYLFFKIYGKRKLPSFKSSMHSKVTSNWKGLKNGEGLSRTTTLHTWTLAI